MKFLQQINKILISPIVSRIGPSLDVASGCAGTIFASRIAFGAEIDDPAEIYLAIFTPVAVALMLLGNQHLKKIIFDDRTKQLKNDKKIINQAIEFLEREVIEKKVEHQYPNDVKEIMRIIDDVKETNKNLENNKYTSEDLSKAISHLLMPQKPYGNKPYILSAGIDAVPVAVASFMSVYIYFLLVMVLKKQLNNKGINYPGATLSLIFAAFRGLASLALAHQKRQILTKKEKKNLVAIHHYFSLFNKLPRDQQELKSEDLQKLFKFWKEQEINKRIEVSTRETTKISSKDLVMS